MRLIKYHIAILIAGLCLYSSFAVSQNCASTGFINVENCRKSIKRINKKLKKDTSEAETNTHLLFRANCYLHMFDFNNSLKDYLKVIPRPGVDYYYKNVVQCYIGLNNIDSAISFVIASNKPELSLLLDHLKKWNSDTSVYTISKQKNINTVFSEISCSPSSDSTATFISNRESDNYTLGPSSGSNKRYKVYVFSGDNKIVKEKSPFTSDLQVGPLSYTKDYTTAFFTKSTRLKGGNTSTQQIYYAEKVGNDWSKAKPFKYNNSAYSFLHPAISKDGKILIFSSNLKGSVGGYDLYVSYHTTDSSWSVPANLGSHINTFHNEVFAYIDKDYRIFFASQGHPGYGGLDVFYAIKTHNNWSDVHNLKPPINTSYDDFALIHKTDSSGYITSNRSGGLGGDDIYYFKKKVSADTKYKKLYGELMLSKHYPAKNVLLHLLDENQLEIESAFTDSVGHFEFNKLEETTKYSIEVDENTLLLSNKARMYINNENGERLQEFTLNENGQFDFFYLTPDEYKEMPIMEEEDPELLVINLEGVLFNDSVGDYTGGGEIYIHSDNDEILYSAEINKNGGFKFENLPPDKAYIFKMDTDDPVGNLTLFDEFGNKKTTIKSNNKGQFIYHRLPHDGATMMTVNAQDEAFQELVDIFGEVFNKKSGDLKRGREVFILDDAGYILFTAKLDDKGTFDFVNLPYEDNFIFKIYGEDVPLSFFITDGFGNVIKSLKSGRDGNFKLEMTSSVKSKMSVFKEAVAQDLELVDYFGQAYKELPGDIPEGEELYLLDDHGEIISAVVIGKNGFFIFEHLPHDRPYSFKLKNYIDGAKLIFLDADREVVKVVTHNHKNQFFYEYILSDRFSLSMVSENDEVLHLMPYEHFVVPNIYYDYGKATITAPAAKQLDKLVGILAVNPNLKVRLFSHTDMRGSEMVNLSLSENRAQSAVKYVTSKGINPNKITGIGMGKSQQLIKCITAVDCTEDQHAKNRRTEIEFSPI